MEMKKIEPVYTEFREVSHHLLKLEVANGLKNTAILATDEPDWRPMEHCHWFHTVDSDGKKQQHCSPVAGHFHEVKYSIDAKGMLSHDSVSGPPITWTSKKKNGQQVKVLAPVNDVDTHTHPVAYEKSNKIPVRSLSPEAAKVISKEAAKGQGIPGIV